MACGVPVVASDIAAYRGYAAGAATLVPHDDAAAFAQAARALLADPETWRRARRAGLAAAAAFSEDRAGAAAEEAMAWVAEGRWRAELPPSHPPGPGSPVAVAIDRSSHR
jgi:glycosyltransferase involved in cell wall biosynthesis